ncbi:hypothetical protein BH11ACT5_BH11ACT5_24810 [soil metagenome]
MSLEDAPTDAAAVAPRRRRLVTTAVAAGALVLLVAGGAIAAPLILRGPAPKPGAAPHPTATSVAAAPLPTATPTATPSATPSPSPTPVPTANPDADAAPPANAPDPTPPKPAPPVPAPPLPAPPTPVILPSFDSITAIPTDDICDSRRGVTLTWSISNAPPNSVTVRVKSGGGTPVFDQSWPGREPQETYTFSNVDCQRHLWFFFITATNPTGSKTALLTFADGTNKGWSAN